MNTNEAPVPLMDLEHVSLKIGERTVLKNISFTIPAGSFIGVIGEGGAGKSSLLKLMTGVLRKTSGTLRFEGKELASNYNPIISSRYKIMAIYQNPLIIPALNACQNIFFSREIKKGVLYDHRAMRRQVLEAFRILSLNIDPDLPLEFYNSDQHLWVEIARILCFEPKLVLLDDISTRLTPPEQEKVFGMFSAMLKEGVSVVYFSSSFIDALHHADKVLILKNGEIVDEVEKDEEAPQLKVDHAQFFTRDDLERKNLELFYQQLFNESIVNTLPLPILVLNPRQEIVFANHAMIDLWGIKRGELKSISLSRLLKVPEETLEKVYGKIRSREEALLRDVTIQAMGKTTQVSIRCLPIFRRETYFGMIFLFMDSKEAEMSREERKVSAVYDSLAKSIAKAAHEINNPLGIILNYIQLIKSSSSIEEVHESIAPIEKEINRIKRIIGSLMKKDFEPEGPSPYGASFSILSRMIPELKNLLDPIMREQNIDLKVQGEEEAAIHIHEDQCKQVLLNILMNSIEAMPAGGLIEIKYGKTFKKNKSFGYISVRDTGTGIKKEILPRIFDLFYSTKAEKQAKGIGLSLCKDIVEKSGGFITVASEEGKGAEFTVLVPEMHPPYINTLG